MGRDKRDRRLGSGSRLGAQTLETREKGRGSPRALWQCRYFRKLVLCTHYSQCTQKVLVWAAIRPCRGFTGKRTSYARARAHQEAEAIYNEDAPQRRL